VGYIASLLEIDTPVKRYPSLRQPVDEVLAVGDAAEKDGGAVREPRHASHHNRTSYLCGRCSPALGEPDNLRPPSSRPFSAPSIAFSFLLCGILVQKLLL